MIFVVVDSNLLLRSFGFVALLGREKNVQIIVPRAVVEELKYRANLDVLKRLRTKPQNGKVKKLEKTIALALKRWPQVEKKIRSGEWKVAGSYRKRIVPQLIGQVAKMGLKNISITDVRIVATALALKNDNNTSVKILSLDKSVVMLARKNNINVPPIHGWEKHFWKEEVLK